METQREILKVCMSKGFLLDKEMLDLFSKLSDDAAKEIVEILSVLEIGERVITKALFGKNIERIKRTLVDGKNKTTIEKFFINFGYSKEEIEVRLGGKEEETQRGVVKLLSNPIINPRKVEVQDFVKHFRSRFELIKKILEERGLENLSSIRRIGNSRENYTVIGLVLEKRITKNKNLIFIIEDLTGSVSVLVNFNKKEVFEKAKDILEDDVVAFSVTGSKEILFANDVSFPDAFLSEKRRNEEEALVAFISDIHAGSVMFLENNFLKFVKWLNGEEGDKIQREMAKKVRYLFINGDSVDGVGHFPGQEKWLNILDMKGQYKKVTELLKLIRKDIKIIFAPGNHDAVWVGEPQPIISEEWAGDLYKMGNVVMVPNPCMVEIDGGFKILMYHGGSMHSMINDIEYLRVNYGCDAPAKVGVEILKRRHLAPTHGNVDYIPGEKEDELVIKYVPDILTTADLHRHEVGVHNNILIIATSCWQSKTPFQEKVGNHPDFCKVPIFNLKTREIKIMDFFDEEIEKETCGESGEEIKCEVKK